MGQVAVNVNGRSYRFDCGDGEEARLEELAAYIKDRIDTLKREYGQVGAERLMLMAALLITDELWDARAAIVEKAAANGQPGTPVGARAATPVSVPLGDQPNGQTSVPTGSPSKGRASAEKREQDAIRSEYRRKVASGDV
jgi:cell division protein ZapA